MIKSNISANKEIEEIIKAAILVDDLIFRMNKPCEKCPQCQTPCPFDMLYGALKKVGIDGSMFASRSIERDIDKIYDEYKDYGHFGNGPGSGREKW